METHSSTLAWKIPWTEEPNQLQSMGLKVSDTTKQLSSIQSLNRVQLSATPFTAACQASMSITNSWNLLKLMPMESVRLSNHLILCCLLLLLPSILPSIRVFQLSQLFASCGQSIGVSASTLVIPMNTQD